MKSHKTSHLNEVQLEKILKTSLVSLKGYIGNILNEIFYEDTDFNRNQYLLAIRLAEEATKKIYELEDTLEDYDI